MELILFLLLVAPVAMVHSQLRPIDCDDIYQQDKTTSSGIYTIFPGGPTSPLKVYCDMETDGGRWTVIQRRVDGTVHFHKPWVNYKHGFGNIAGDYWLGLDNMFFLTMRKKDELRVDMEDWAGEKAYAHYDSFSVANETLGYQLHVGSYVGGDAGDSLAVHNNLKFTTYDKDQDNSFYNCAQSNFGGFWFNECYGIKLNGATPNGLYTPEKGSELVKQQINWYTWKTSLKRIAMKIRPAATQKEQE